MANMEFLQSNRLNTTTMIVASTGTGTFAYAFDRNTNLSYSTVGNTTNTSTQISIQFIEPTVITHLVLQNHNLLQYRAFYNSLTANTFSPAINVTANSQSSTYFSFTGITISSIQIQMDRAMVADVERRIGEVLICNRQFQFTVNPSHGDYKPRTSLTKVLHKMPDGGMTAFNIRNKYHTNIKLEYITTAYRDSLRTVFDNALPVHFLPFPTTGSTWDGMAPEVIWTNDFNFSHAENSKTQGFSGDIELMETPSA